MLTKTTICASLFTLVTGFTPPAFSGIRFDSSTATRTQLYSSSRRNFVSEILATTAAVVVAPQIVNAGIDPSALKNYRIEGDDSGAATRLRQIEAIKNPADDMVDKPFTALSSGVSYREYREGKGEATVGPGSKVAVEMTIRMKSFSTQKEPGGIKYFSTKDDTQFNEVAWTVGSGELLPGLEEAMMGMRKRGLRRIEVPSTQIFAAKKADQLPLPTTNDGQRRFDRLFKTDATLLFEVLVTRIK
mmetsp:Transcript_28725/g.44125  ORF Transcript_28725/g.44125 Transcript_28725/m.44125 type:complete len:245 (-) Transcript_28725:80-814(-)